MPLSSLHWYVAASVEEKPKLGEGWFENENAEGPEVMLTGGGVLSTVHECDAPLEIWLDQSTARTSKT